MPIKTQKVLDSSFDRCTRQKTFIQIDKLSFRDYRDEALADLDAAKKELANGTIKWAIVKAYQALFLQCTAVLVKTVGVYSKDHGCLLIALLKHNIVSVDVLSKIETMLSHKKTLFEEIERLRISRNKALYFPKTQNIIAAQEAEHIIEEVRSLLVLLGEQL
ncbi:HEPN domain-containing protein [Candidatus Woesearchaeota archaeon]|nr:HEPN domain-containing protein [Candidatus Woesearchaeota archaeon]